MGNENMAPVRLLVEESEQRISASKQKVRSSQDITAETYQRLLPSLVRLLA
jgi:hypothetical protein